MAVEESGEYFLAGAAGFLGPIRSSGIDFRGELTWPRGR